MWWLEFWFSANSGSRLVGAKYLCNGGCRVTGRSPVIDHVHPLFPPLFPSQAWPLRIGDTRITAVVHGAYCFNPPKSCSGVVQQLLHRIFLLRFRYYFKHRASGNPGIDISRGQYLLTYLKPVGRSTLQPCNKPKRPQTFVLIVCCMR